MKKAELNSIELFLIGCGGGDVSKLEENDIKPDINKQVGIGGAVLFTGIFASFSFGYAMTWVFENTPVCVFLGVVWGLMIFNLDRLIVSGSIKTSKNSLSYYVNFVVRFILAIGISLIISVPLELKLFESLLNKENIAIELKHSAELNEVKAEVSKYDSLYHYETAGKGEGDGEGDGPVAKGLEKIKNQKLQRQSNIENRIRSGQNETLGLLERFRALESLKKDPDIKLVANGIMLLFLLIEVIPILIKSFSTDAVYEDSIRDKIIEVRKGFKNKDTLHEIPESKESQSKLKEQMQQKILDTGFSVLVALCSYYFTRDMNYTSIAGIAVFLLFEPLKNLVNEKS
jgi:hypothetical protein